MLNVADSALEIIVVDNASTDATKEIIQRYQAITYVFEAEKGITRARQRGLLSARGDVLAFVDADTRPSPGWIDKIAGEFEKDEKLACISGPYSFYDLQGIAKYVTNGWFRAAMLTYRMTGYLIVGGNFAIRRDVLQKMGGFDERIQFYGEDVDIAKRAVKYGKVLFSAGLVMPTSARRMKKLGFAKMAMTYFINYVSIVVRGKPATESYSDVR